MNGGIKRESQGWGINKTHMIREQVWEGSKKNPEEQQKRGGVGVCDSMGRREEEQLHYSFSHY